MATDSARIFIWQSHPLFRLIWAATFNKTERLALSYNGGKVTIAANQIQLAVTATVFAGWRSATKSILAHCVAHQIDIDTNELLFAAASIGHIQAMREAIAIGATEFDTALASAAKRGHIEAMREAIRMGATNLDDALATAAEKGHIAAMREARTLGATDFDRALNWAAAGGHIAAMREARSMGATDFNYTLGCAAKEGQMGAIREAIAMGATDFLWALENAKDQETRAELGWTDDA